MTELSARYSKTLYGTCRVDGLSDFYFAFQKKIFTGCNRLSCGRCIWNTERISDFYRWGKTDFLDPLYDICGFSDGCFCFLLL